MNTINKGEPLQLFTEILNPDDIDCIDFVTYNEGNRTINGVEIFLKESGKQNIQIDDDEINDVRTFARVNNLIRNDDVRY